VPKDGVFAGNGHPSFPILNPLVYKCDDAVWHGGFFSEPRTIRHIEKLLEIENEDSVPLDQVVAGTRGSGGPRPVPRFGLTDASRDAFESGRQQYSPVERDLERPALRSGDTTGTSVVLPASESASQVAVVEREPLIQFHEVVESGVPNELTVLLSEVMELDKIENRLAIEFAAGEDQIELTVELSAPGFTIVGERTARMLIKRARDPETEKAKFNLVAKSPGAKPVTRTIMASFFRGGDCLGGATHTTEVIPAGYSGEYMAGGEDHANRVVISSRQRVDADLIVYVLEDTAHPNTFEIAIRSNIPGEEYQMREKGTLKLEGTDFSNFFGKVIDPQFQSFPRGTLKEAEFDAALGYLEPEISHDSR
jgi:hypothetical protein